MYQIMLVEDEALVRESMAQNTNWEKFGFAPPHVFENGRQALEQLRTSTVTLKESEEKWEEGMISVFELMEKRNLYILAKAELSRTRLQYELKSRTVDFYRTGTFLVTE